MSVIRAFTLEQAATVAHISTRRASYWASRDVLVPTVLYDTTATPHRYLYDFADVVGLRTLGMLRDRFGLSLQQLRKANAYLREHAHRPWSELRFWMRGKELLFADPESQQIVSASHPGQAAIAIEIEQVARSVEDDAQALAGRRAGDIGKVNRKRNVQGNRLVVKGTRVPIRSIINLDEDGYTPEDVVRAFPSLTLQDVRLVLEEHRREGAA